MKRYGNYIIKVGNLINLIYLNLSNNQFSGDIPTEIGNLVNLRSLDLETNQLSGIPESIGNLDNLSKLLLSSNQFTHVPESICNLNLDWNDFNSFLCGDNYICEEIPECIENTIGFNYSYDWDIHERIYNPQNTSECECDEGYTDVEGVCTLVCDDGLTNVDGECISLNNSDTIIPTVYNLSSPYPNPFNPTTTISFSIPQLQMVSLKIYDITGKLITTLINEQLNIGYHSINWDGTNQSSGVYYVRMESGDYIETQKLVLVK